MTRRQDPTREERDRSEDLDLPDERIPVSVLTGFLGSGKTTVLLEAGPAPA